jgi:hypothetical protein
MTEKFFRHGLYLMLFSYIDDPIYLEEPMVRSQNWTWNPGGNMGFGPPFESVDELGDKPPGWVPFFALGTHHAEYAEMHHLPFKATQGGRESLYPEYMKQITQFAAEEAADQAATAANKAAATTKR